MAEPEKTAEPKAACASGKKKGGLSPKVIMAIAGGIACLLAFKVLF